MNKRQRRATRIILRKTFPKYTKKLICYDRFLYKLRKAGIITGVEESEVIASSDPILFSNLHRWNRLFILLMNRNAILHILAFLNESYSDLCGGVDDFLDEVRDEFWNSPLLREFAALF
jgi:hypothetical protein